MTTSQIKIEGKIKRLFQKQQITDNFSKREVWIEETEGQYPNTFCVEFPNDKGSQLDQFKEGDIVSIDVNLRGKSWVSKDGTKEGCNTNLSGWKVTKLGESTPAADSSPSVDAFPENDLPF